MTNITIVLVEEQNLYRSRLKNILEQVPKILILGEAERGGEGWQIIEQTQPDLAIIDMSLPDINGIELTKMIKQSTVAHQTKVLMLGWERDAQTVLAALAAGADSYLVKEVDLSYLTMAVKETCQGNAWLDPQITKGVLRQLLGEGLSKYTAKVSPKPSAHLTDRELQVLALIVSGCNNALIAEKLFITVGTVKTHVRSILNKLAVEDRTQAAVTALKTGLVR